MRTMTMTWLCMIFAALLSMGFSACSESDDEELSEDLSSDSTVPVSPSVEYITYENLGSDEWTYLVVQDSENLMLIKDSLGHFIKSYGTFGGKHVIIISNQSEGTISVHFDNVFEMKLHCEDYNVWVYTNNSCHVFPVEDLLWNTRAVSDKEVLSFLFNETVGNLIPETISLPIKLMKYLYQTDDMNHHQKIDYILNGDYELVPPEMIDRMFGWADEKIPETILPAYYLGIHTGHAEVNTRTATATCYMDGYLRAEANDGEFNFDYGICMSTSQIPTVNDYVQKHMARSNLTSSINVRMPISFTFSGLELDKTYYYRAYFKNNVTNMVEYAKEIKSFETYVGLCPDNNHPHVIDLGLSGETKWACCNVDADSPEKYGGYYAWGETEEKSEYTAQSYKFYYEEDLNGDGDCFDYGEFSYKDIGTDISGTQYDVSRVKWGGSWRMPTSDEIDELSKKCTWTWISKNGVNGYLVTGPNGNSIFLPAAGYRYGTDLNYRGSCGDYWSATLNENGSGYVYGLYFYAGNRGWNYYRYFGHSVRPVTE